MLLHISRHFLGEIAVFEPRIPVSQNEKEINMPPRICASNELSLCWDSIRKCNDLIYEMQKNNVTGYYFFVYQFTNPEQFVKSEVYDANETGEMNAFQNQEAKLISCFYVASHRLRNGLLSDKVGKPAFEFSSNEEAINAYNEYQKIDLIEIEKSL